MNADNDIAFELDVDLREETLIALTSAVDQLDDLHMIIGGIVFAPAEDVSLEQYVERATRYLVYLLERIRADDLRHVSTTALDEVHQRSRISKLLHASNLRARA